MTTCTIEVNLDDDFSCSTAYHVDYLWVTVQRNMENFRDREDTDNWQVIALAESLEEALDKCKDIQKEMCEKFGIPFKVLPLSD